MLYSYKNQYPTQLPDRIRLSDGTTRTNMTTFTEQEIADAGYVEVSNPPIISEYETLKWVDNNWLVESISEAEKIEREWIKVRKHRDILIGAFDWRINRYYTEVRLGLTPTDDIEKVDFYMQKLRDITKQSDPFNITWPEFELGE